MITGDHAVTAAAIARQLGIDGTVITGAEFAAITDDELLTRIDDIGVIARVTPEHKVRLVDTLKRKGQIVAMTGDGVNDAPALKRADIGPDIQHRDHRIGADADPGHRVRAAAEAPGDHQPRYPAMAHLQLRRTVDRRRL